MSTEDNKNLVNQLMNEDILGNDSKYSEVIDRYYTPDSVTHIAGVDVNNEQWMGISSVIYNAFSDIGITTDDTVTEGDKVVVRLTWEGTHKGEYLGVAPTGKKVKIDGIVIYKIADGKIAETWMLTDTFGMMIQLGAIPNPYV